MNLRFVLTLALLTQVGCSTHLPAVPPHPFEGSAAKVTPGLELCWLETAGTESWGGFGSAGQSTSATWEATASAILVRHPRGDLLIDSGSPPRLEDELLEVSLVGQVLTRNLFGRMTPRGELLSLLREAGSSPEQLKAVVVSHVHGDHAGGLRALPGVPVWLPKEELAFTRKQQQEGGWRVIPAQARAILSQAVELRFESGPYANFERSHDVFGDGSVVVVPLFGHTPGSVGVFLNLSATRRLLHVGDTLNTAESLDRGVRKSWLMRTLTDDDEELAAAQGARLVELHRADPVLKILPAHDRVAWKGFFGPPAAGRNWVCVKG